MLGAFFAMLIVCFKHGKNIHAKHDETTLDISIDEKANNKNTSKENTNVNIEHEVPLIEAKEHNSKRYSESDIDEVLRQLDEHIQDEDEIYAETTEADSSQNHLLSYEGS